MEDEREDIDPPLFMAWRVVVMPFKNIELGLSRTAQFCGDGLSCDLKTFGNMLAGNDNVWHRRHAGERTGQPDGGIRHPLGFAHRQLPYAIYARRSARTSLPTCPPSTCRSSVLEVWKPLRDGGLVQVFAEYASTTCSANTGSGPYYNCAYNQGLFNVEGYRYKGDQSDIPLTATPKTRLWAARTRLLDGDLWTATARARGSIAMTWRRAQYRGAGARRLRRNRIRLEGRVVRGTHQH